MTMDAWGLTMRMGASGSARPGITGGILVGACARVHRIVGVRV